MSLLADFYDEDHKSKMLQTAPMGLLCMVMGANRTEIYEASQEYARAVSGSIIEAGEPYILGAKHYRKEFGNSSLWKQIVLVKVDIEPADFVSLKYKALEVEKEFAVSVEDTDDHEDATSGNDSRIADREGQSRKPFRLYRRVNIDPGVLSIGSLHMVSTKYAGHRICLSPGLWAEVTLHFTTGSYHPLPWTFPDFREDEVREYLRSLRQRHLLGRWPNNHKRD